MQKRQKPVDETRVLRLLRGMESTLVDLDLESAADSQRRADPLWLPGVKYLLQTSIEACIDVAQHLCATEGWGPPQDNGDAMRLLGERQVITAELAINMRMAVGFRNVLVHEYVEVEDSIVFQRVQDHSHLRDFARSVITWMDEH